jgi:fatty-acyl-CoA synthase
MRPCALPAWPRICRWPLATTESEEDPLNRESASGASFDSGGGAARFCGQSGVMDLRRTVLAQLADVAQQLARPSGRAAWLADLRLLPLALRYAAPWAVLGRTSRDANPYRWLDKQVRDRPHDVALSDRLVTLTFAQLAERSQRIAATLLGHGVKCGDRVAIVLPTNVALVTSLLGCWLIGAVPCPLDPEAPESLGREVFERLTPAWVLTETNLVAPAQIDESRRICLDTVEAAEPRSAIQRARLRAASTAMVLPTSGSEGTMKLCCLSAGRLALSGHAFGGLALQCRRGDVIYCPLPLNHATAVTVAMMPALVHGVTLHLAGKFSATRFWDDVRSSRATQLVYVGDLWRYVLAATPTDRSPEHGLRVVVGNGLDRATWQMVLERLHVPKVVEFYGATEAPSVLLNFSGKLGSIGRVPLRRLSRYRVVRVREAPPPFAEPWTDCAPGEVGELWIRLPRGKRPWLGDFEGYLDQGDEQRALIEDALCTGDRYYRTGDLVKFDEDDNFSFVDRLGDVWRSKGHNVSTSWLASVLREVDGVADACVVPIALDDSSRRFGLAVVVTNGRDVLGGIEARLRELPAYARPQLLQIRAVLPRTATCKVNKAAWRAKCWAPSDHQGPLYVWRDGWRRVPVTDWAAIKSELLRR